METMTVNEARQILINARIPKHQIQTYIESVFDNENDTIRLTKEELIEDYMEYILK